MMSGRLLSLATTLPLLFLPMPMSRYANGTVCSVSSFFVDTYTDKEVLADARNAELASIHIEIPFSVNGQPVTLSARIVYDTQTKTVSSSGLLLYGPGSPDGQTNYARPIASYNPDGSIEFIGNLGFQYKSTLERKLVDREGAAITLSAGPKTQLISEPIQPQPYTLSPADILYVRFTINDKAGHGQGEVQLGGTKGPVYRYRIIPK